MKHDKKVDMIICDKVGFISYLSEWFQIKISINTNHVKSRSNETMII